MDYPRDNKQLPSPLQTFLQSENIELDEVVKIYPKFLKYSLLVTVPIPNSKLVQKYFDDLVQNLQRESQTKKCDKKA